MNNTLKPCPFCGGSAAIKWVDGKPWLFAACTQCGARGLSYIASHGASEDEAAAAWNARTFEKCASCGGSGLSLNGAGEPDTCRVCRGNTVVHAQPLGWHEAETAPTDGSEFIACNEGFLPFSCQFWQGDFVHLDPDDGEIRYAFTHWMHIPPPPTPKGRMDE